MLPRALIVDDEAPAREELRYLLDELGTVQVVGEATNGEEALVLLSSLDYDIVFLDVRMPGLNGLEVTEQLHDLPNRPRVVFTTAYPEHAVEAFDLAAADYLVKPFDGERLQRAIERGLALAPEASDESPAEPPTSPADSSDQLARIPVHLEGRTVLVEGNSIVYAAAARGYSTLVLNHEQVTVTYSLAEIERRLPDRFFRVHRSYLVNLRHVRELVRDPSGTLVLVMNDRRRSMVEVSRRHSRELRRRLGV